MECCLQGQPVYNVLLYKFVCSFKASPFENYFQFSWLHYEPFLDLWKTCAAQCSNDKARKSVDHQGESLVRVLGLNFTALL